MILSLVSGAVLGIYSSGLTLLSLGVRIPRPAAALRRRRHPHPGHDLGRLLRRELHRAVPVVPDHARACRWPSWAGIMIADIALRKRDYDDEDLFDARGRYGAFDWVSIGTMVVASVIGWGLVVNNFADGRRVEQLAGLPARAARPGHVRHRPRRPLLGRQLGLLQPRRAARPRARLRRDLRRSARHGCVARRPRAPTVAGRAPPSASRPGDRRLRRRLAGRRRPAGGLRRPGHLAVGLAHVGGHGAAHRRARGILRSGAHGGDPVRGRPLAGRVVGPLLPRLAVRARARLRPAVCRGARARRRRRARRHGRDLRQVAGAARPGRRRRPPDPHRGVDRLLRALDGPSRGGCRGEVRVVRSGCAGSSPENHERALAAMALYAPQITIT